MITSLLGIARLCFLFPSGQRLQLVLISQPVLGQLQFCACSTPGVLGAVAALAGCARGLGLQSCEAGAMGWPGRDTAQRLGVCCTNTSVGLWFLHGCGCGAGLCSEAPTPRCLLAPLHGMLGGLCWVRSQSGAGGSELGRHCCSTGLTAMLNPCELWALTAIQTQELELLLESRNPSQRSKPELPSAVPWLRAVLRVSAHRDSSL